MLTPFMIDREHPFPYIPSSGLCMVIQGTNAEEQLTHILIPIPPSVQRFMVLPGDESRVIAVESLIILFCQSLFSDFKVTDCGTFQILRDNDLALAEKFDDLREMVETGLKQRQRANVIRLKFVDDMAEESQFFVAEALGVLDSDEIEAMREENLGIAHSPHVVIDELLGLSDALSLISSSLAPRYPELTFATYEPRTPARIKESPGDIFSVIRERDLMLHYPYDTFSVLIYFIQNAATDPDVIAIKQTLYRTNDGSPIVSALIAAAESGDDSSNKQPEDHVITR